MKAAFAQPRCGLCARPSRSGVYPSVPHKPTPAPVYPGSPRSIQNLSHIGLP